VPAFPKIAQGAIIGHTSQHVLRRIDTIGQSPKAKKSPYDEELQPHHLQENIRKDSELRWRQFCLQSFEKIKNFSWIDHLI
jgi:hypothetical protein